MKAKVYKIRTELAPVLKKMLEEKKALQEFVKNGGSAYDIVKARNNSTGSL